MRVLQKLPVSKSAANDSIKEFHIEIFTDLMTTYNKCP